MSDGVKFSKSVDWLGILRLVSVCLPLVLLCGPCLCGDDVPLDINNDFEKIHAQLESRESSFDFKPYNPSAWEEHKKWLENLYKRLGYSIEIDNRSEWGIYLMGLSFSTSSTQEYKKLQEGSLRPRGKKLSRKEYLEDWIKTQYDIGKIPFDKEKWINAKWRSADRKLSWVRYRMFKDFKTRHPLKSMSVDELESMLGKSDYSSENFIRYEMGPEIGFKLLNGKSGRICILLQRFDMKLARLYNSDRG